METNQTENKENTGAQELLVSQEQLDQVNKLNEGLKTAHELHDSLQEKLNKKSEPKPYEPTTISKTKTYAQHEVQPVRKADSVGKNFSHEGFDYVKGKFVRDVNILPEQMEEANKQSHNSRYRYYEKEA